MHRGLVADDDPEIRAAVEEALVNAGFQVFLAENGRQAVHAARTMAFDFAVVDYSMPPLSGVEVLAALRQMQPACASVLLSGQLNLPIVSEALRRGDISRILSKPVDANTLVQTVQDAMRARREQGESLMTSLMERKGLERDALRECFAGQLSLVLQPFVETRGRRVVGYEALLRSRHPVLTGPLEVIEAAERNGEIHHLADSVFRMAAALLEKIDARLQLFINLHPLELGDPERVGDRLRLIEAHRSRVVLEITERSDLAGLPQSTSSVDLMRARGFSVAVDDLGSGYSSLSALAHVKPEFMKVDMSIVRGVDSDVHKRRLIALLARFARSSGSTLIAEGVETEAEAAALTTVGAHWMQGYLFGRPAAA